MNPSKNTFLPLKLPCFFASCAARAIMEATSVIPIAASSLLYALNMIDISASRMTPPGAVSAAARSVSGVIPEWLIPLSSVIVCMTKDGLSSDLR